MPNRSNSIHLLPWVLIALMGCAGPSAAMRPGVASGLQKGDDIIPWNPIHVAGPNAGTNACPVCTYGARPAIVMFTRDDKNLPAFASQLQSLVNRQQKQDLKGFVIVLNSTPNRVKQLGTELKITQIGWCYPDPNTEKQDLKDYKINPAAQS
jgi:hypothetical protein